MNTVGKILIESRKLKNISIETVAKELKISISTLIKLENDEVRNDSNIVFHIGHLRSYSQYLDLNTHEIIKKFKKQISYNQNEIIKNISKPSFKNYYFNLSKYFSAGLIVMIFTSFYLLFIDKDNNDQEYALVPEIPEINIPIIEKTELDLALKNINSEGFELKENTSQNFSSAIASQKVEKDISNNTITLKFLNSTWIQLRDKEDKIILSRLMEKDEEYSYSINLNYSITVGNAGNILVLIDDNVRGKLGKYGEILDSYILDNKFNN